MAAAARHVLATVDTTNAGLPEQFLEIFARALAGFFGVRFGHLKLAVAGAVAFCLFGAGGMVLLFEAAALPLDLAEVAQHGREDRDLVLAAVAGWAGGKSVLPLEGASEFALDLYADSGGVGMDGSALDVEDAALVGWVLSPRGGRPRRRVVPPVGPSDCAGGRSALCLVTVVRCARGKVTTLR